MVAEGDSTWLEGRGVSTWLQMAIQRGRRGRLAVVGGVASTWFEGALRRDWRGGELRCG